MDTERTCPFHQPTTPAATVPARAGWPPGPRAGLTGWRLLAAMARDLPAALSAWQREFGDVVHLRIWPEHQVVVSDPQLLRELLLSHHDDLVRWERGVRVFGELQGDGLVTAEGEAWRRQRHALQPAFSASAVQAFVPAMAATVRDALARWPADGTSFGIESALTSLAMDVMLRMLFSSELGEDARTAERAAHTVVQAAGRKLFWPASWPLWAPWKRAERQAHADLHALVDRHVAARLRQPPAAWPEDLLSALLRLHRQDPAAWPLQAVHDQCLTLFFAGHETTAGTLAWWAWCMAAHPQAQADARAEVQRVLQGRAPTGADLRALHLLTQTLQETLRLHPATPLLFTRRARRGLQLGPWRLPAGTMLLLPVQLMHHDARWFADPLAFRPERFGPGAPEFPRGAFQPFGAGPRACLGQHLAMTEMTLVAAMLLQRFTLSVPQGAAAPKPAMQLTLRPAQRLQLRVDRCAAP